MGAGFSKMNDLTIIQTTQVWTPVWQQLQTESQAQFAKG